VTITDIRTFTFGPAPPRMLTLTGENADNNTLAPVVGNASDGGVVGVTKDGPGRWILTGNNSYTGATNVNAGTLLINGTQTGGGLTTVAAGATLGGTGALSGGLTMAEGSHYLVEFSAGTVDPLAINGDVDLSAMDNFLDVSGMGTGTSWIIASYTGMLTGLFENIAAGYTVDYGTSMNSVITLMAAPGLGGDFNDDGKVDAADYVVWRKALGTMTPLPNDNGIGGTVGLAHFDLWRANFGNMAMPGSGAGSGTGAVPEPACWILAMVALVGSTFMRRRQTPPPE
jgi:fibronectin-binding autotransporter adhesin